MKQVELTQDDWGQVVDGLACRAEQYEATAGFYETGVAEGEILEVSDADEARSLAAVYWALVDKIRKQL